MVVQCKLAKSLRISKIIINILHDETQKDFDSSFEENEMSEGEAEINF